MIEEKIDRIEKAVEQTQKDVRGLISVVVQTQSDIKSLTGAVAQTQSDVKSLTGAVAQTQSDVKDLIEIVVSMKGYMETKFEEADTKLETFKKETGENFDTTKNKINGLQRAIDSGFERQSALEARVSKVEAELHV